MLPLYDSLRTQRIPLVNFALIALNGLVFFYELGLTESGLNGFIDTWGLVPVHLTANTGNLEAWLNVFTAMFIHGGWLHILSNMWVLFIFGDNVENRMGGTNYLIFYLLSGVAAALLQAFLLPTSAIPMVGASGAIAGVLGAYMLLFPQARVVSLVPILFIFTTVELPAVIFLLLWFGIQLLSGFLTLGGATGSGVAWWAHIGGFLFGILTVFFFTQRRTTRIW
jgi:membrane associated rhomboid family serine protease